MGTLTPAPLLPAPEQVSLIHERTLPDIPSPTTPCAPVFRRCFFPGGLGLRFAFLGYRRFFGLRSLLAVSSVASGRIELVSQHSLRRSSTDYPFASSCSPPRVVTRQLLSTSRREAPPGRDSHPRCTLALKRTNTPIYGGVMRSGMEQNRFNGFPAARSRPRGWKPLERFHPSSTFRHPHECGC